jgi:inhibitor of KinA
MRVEPLGDRGFIVRELSVPAWIWAQHVNSVAPRGLIEAYASYDTVGLEVDPEIFSVDALLEIEAPLSDSPRPRAYEIPVCYEMGEDLEEAAASLGLSVDEVVSIHSSAVYRCEAVGFCPGFPYLSGLDERLHGIPRRSSPRTRVEPGSVAITGAQCGIYPLLRPGGWAILGCTPLEMVNVADGYFPIRAGDEIRFSPINASQFEELKGARL